MIYSYNYKFDNSSSSSSYSTIQVVVVVIVQVVVVVAAIINKVTRRYMVHPSTRRSFLLFLDLNLFSQGCTFGALFCSV